MSQTHSSLIICDSHVHFYGCFQLDHFLNSAVSNFLANAGERSATDHLMPVLMLSEAKDDHWFHQVKSSRQVSASWTFFDTNEAESFFVANASGMQMLIVNGRQIVTSENLEVLALATSEELLDGCPIMEVVDWAIGVDAIPVIPWGFGKWWGHRGEILSGVLDKFSGEQLLLGDNSGRAEFLGKPRQFSRADSDTRRILPGSDPLPFASETSRPGSVGFRFVGSIDAQTPAKSLRDHVRNQSTEITNYMTCERFLPFVKNQVSMQLRKRL